MSLTWIEKQARVFLLADVLFCIIFLLALFIEHSHAILLIVFFSFVLLSYYPLYMYWKESKSEDLITRKNWHHDNEFCAILYAISRAVMLISYVLVSIIERAQIDVIHTLMHLSTFTSLTAISMTVLLVVITIAALLLHRQHAKHSRLDIGCTKSREELILLPGSSSSHVDATSCSRDAAAMASTFSMPVPDKAIDTRDSVAGTPSLLVSSQL